jgi:hypothetical protein
MWFTIVPKTLRPIPMFIRGVEKASDHSLSLSLVSNSTRKAGAPRQKRAQLIKRGVLLLREFALKMAFNVFMT